MFNLLNKPRWAHTHTGQCPKTKSPRHKRAPAVFRTVKMEDRPSLGGQNEGNYKKLFSQEDSSGDEQPSSPEREQQQGIQTRVHSFL